MAIATTTSKVSYDGNDSATTFPYPYKIFSADELEVILTDTDSDNTTLVLNTDYTVTGVGVSTGGNVEYPISGDPLATGEILTINRLVDLLQETDLEEQGAFSANTIERMSDFLTMQTQQLQEQIDRSVKEEIGNEKLNLENIDSITFDDGTIQQTAGVGSSDNLSNDGDVNIKADALDDSSGDIIMKIYNTVAAIIENATKNLIAYYNLIVAKGATFNNEAGDNDFEIKKNTSGTAYKYDAGDDDHTFGGEVKLTTMQAIDGTGISIEDDGGTEAINIADGGGVTFPKSQYREWDLVVDSVADFTTWAAGIFKNVLIKSGSYDVSSLGLGDYIYLSSGTYYVQGEGDVNIIGVGLAYVDRITIEPSKRSMVNINITSPPNRAFSYCYNLENCSAITSSAVGLDGAFGKCENLVNCVADGSNVQGFYECRNLVNCLAENNDNSGFGFCVKISNCNSITNGTGYLHCGSISNSYATSNTTDGFNDCYCISNCNSSNNTTYGFDACSYVSSSFSTANGTGDWNATTKKDSDSCN